MENGRGKTVFFFPTKCRRSGTLGRAFPVKLGQNRHIAPHSPLGEVVDGECFLARFVVFQVFHLKVDDEGMVADNRLFGKANIHVGTLFEEFGSF